MVSKITPQTHVNNPFPHALAMENSTWDSYRIHPARLMRENCFRFVAFQVQGCFCQPVLTETQYSFHLYRPIKRKQITFLHPTFQTAFRRSREIEASKWKRNLGSVTLLLPLLLPNVPPSLYSFPHRRDTVPLATCHRLREAGYQAATEKVGWGTQQEKGWGQGWGPCGH